MDGRTKGTTRARHALTIGTSPATAEANGHHRPRLGNGNQATSDSRWRHGKVAARASGEMRSSPRSGVTWPHDPASSRGIFAVSASGKV